MEETNKETEGKEEKTTSKMDKELYWVLGAMVFIIAIFLVSFTMKEKTDSFDYNGLSFQKEMLGSIPLYKHTYQTGKVSRTTAQVTRTEERSSVVILLRNDPRQLTDIPVDGKIEYPPLAEFVYITVDSSKGLLCDDSTIAIHQLSAFIIQNGFVARPGISDEATAIEQKMEYITCENRPDRMVISLKSGETPSVVRNENCYTITVADCDILAPVEKFVVQSVIDAKERNQGQGLEQ